LTVGAGPLAGRVIFIEGAPRSGTTLLVSLLASHPGIAGTVAESHLFDRGVGALFDNYNRQAQFEGFLSNYVSEEQLAGLVRELCDGVLAAMRERVKPEAERVVEKTPLPRFGAREVMEQKLAVYPDATYVHVVRERDAVVRSLMRAPWADCDEAAAAEWWQQAVSSIRETAGAGDAGYVEVAYEELSADPVGTVAALLGELGLDAGDEVRLRLESVSRERISSFGPPEAGAGGDAAAAPKAVGGGRGQGPEREPAGLAAELRTRASGLASRVEGWRGRRIKTTQDLIVAARAADEAGVAGLTHPSFAFQMRSGAGDLAAEGDAGRVALIEVTAEIFRAQAVSESWTTVGDGESVVLLLAAGHGDGTRTDVVVTALVRGGLVERLAIIAAGAPGGRRPGAWGPPPAAGGNAEGGAP